MYERYPPWHTTIICLSFGNRCRYFSIAYKRRFMGIRQTFGPFSAVLGAYIPKYMFVSSNKTVSSSCVGVIHVYRQCSAFYIILEYPCRIPDISCRWFYSQDWTGWSLSRLYRINRSLLRHVKVVIVWTASRTCRDCNSMIIKHRHQSGIIHIGKRNIDRVWAGNLFPVNWSRNPVWFP